MPPALPCPIGTRVASATIISEAAPRVMPHRNIRQWQLKCDCGMLFTADVNLISAGRINRCGQCSKKALIARNYRHGCAARADGTRATQEYEIWSGMKRRCQNQDDKDYPRYGGRGIRVCDRWKKFENFIADMGPRPSSDHSIERKNNDAGYEPGNCIWATLDVQSQNKRSTKRIEWGGAPQTLSAVANSVGLRKATLFRRLKVNVPLAVAVTTSVSPSQVLRENDARLRQLELDGVRQSTRAWEKQTGVSRKLIAKRLRVGWSISNALLTPVRQGNYRRKVT